MIKKLRLFVAVVFAVLTLTLCVGARTYTGSVNELTWSVDLNSGMLTIDGNGDMPNYTNCYELPWEKFAGIVKTIVVGDGITSVGNCAFMNMSALENVNLPDSVVGIGDSAFEFCKNLKSVNTPKNLKKIGDLAFADCAALESFEFVNTIEQIGVYAFSNCVSLEEVGLEKLNLTEISEGAFSGCSSVSVVNLPDNVTKIGEGAFYLCSALGSIDLREGLEVIGDRAFFCAENLKNVNINNNVSVGVDAFYKTAVNRDVLYGDVNSDGVVNEFDSLKLAEMLAGWEVGLSEYGKLAADVNVDGKINSLDILRLMKKLAGLDVVLGGNA